MKNVILYYSFSFALGGGEFLPLSFIAALQKKCNLTVAVDQACNFECSYKAFGAKLNIDRAKLKIVQVTPPGYNPKRHSAFVSLYRFRRLKRLAKNADICISAASIMDFGRPAHHFINVIDFGDSAFTDFAFGRIGSPRAATAPGLKRRLADAFLRFLLGMRTKRSIILNKQEHIYPNSDFVNGLMSEYYGTFNSTVFYPPTLFEPNHAASVERDPLRVVYIGRIIPEKKITDMIYIVEKARAETGRDIKFEVAGRLDQTPWYGEKLQALAVERPWLKFAGELYGDAKIRFLLSGSYALHAERIEAFGISITEYLKAGLTTLTPNQGGACEIVGCEDLSFMTNEDAVAKLARLVTDSAFAERMRKHCQERAKTFSRAAYEKRQCELLDKILS